MRWFLLLAALLCGCSSPAAVTDAAVDASVAPLGGSRPLATFRVPENWDQKTPLPLLLVLHGFGVGGLAQAIYFNVLPLVDEKQIFLAAPDGTMDSKGRRFWNAVDSCCDFEHTGVDDVKYLTDLVNEIATRYPVDRKRIYVMGHSNGGAMSLRLACDKTGTFAAALELAGPFWSNPPVQCQPATTIPLRVLHGTADTAVPYAGGFNDGGSAEGPLAIANFFAQKNGCTTLALTSDTLDVDTSVAGAETKVWRSTGCAPSADVELWSMEGSEHIPPLAPSFRSIAWNFFSAHTR
jgi:polyhydroxybutyrate depolymerase